MFKNSETKENPIQECCEDMRFEQEYANVIVNDGGRLRIKGTSTRLHYCPFCGCRVGKKRK